MAYRNFWDSSGPDAERDEADVIAHMLAQTPDDCFRCSAPATVVVESDGSGTAKYWRALTSCCDAHLETGWGKNPAVVARAEAGRWVLVGSVPAS